jgi:hypothetical protein
MIPQERDMLANLVDRVRQSPQQQRDPEAEAIIGDLVRQRPDAPYVLAQTVLVQDYALHQAQARIAELEQQLKGQQSNHGGFLSSIFGSGRDPQPAPRQPPAPYQPQAPQTGYAQPAAGPWGAAPTMAPQVFAQPAGQPSFLRSAATTAAGVAGGALLFEGIESLFGGHGGYGGMGGGFGGAGFGGFGPQPGLTETVVNNYYEEPAGGAGQPADFQQGGFDNASFNDAPDDMGGNFDAGGDFGGGDFGGGGDFSSDV